LAKIAEASDATLVVFPERGLQCPERFEYLRDDIFSLANHGNVDVLVSLDSSLAGGAGSDRVRRFPRQPGAVPCLGLGMKDEGIPCISFDAYAGMTDLLLHCVNVHGASRIAFLRGRENDLYRAYIDVLEASGIAYDPLLVSDPFGPTEGAKALGQLMDGRHLLPGRDFDTLACASDLMLLDAGKRLEGLGISIPDDVRAVGFGDSPESNLLEVPCTTVRMPIHEMATMAWTVAMDMLEKPGTPIKDIVLPTECVIRRSCGCSDREGSWQRWLTAEFDIHSSAAGSRLKSLLVQCASYDGSDSHVAASIEETVRSLSYRYLDRGGDPGRLVEALRRYERHVASREFVQKLGGPIREIFLRQQDLVSREHAYARSNLESRLSALHLDLLGLRDRKALPELLFRHLPSMGMDSAYLVLYGEEGESVFVGGFGDRRQLAGPERFDRSRLLPPRLGDTLRNGVYTVEPLFSDRRSLGYLLLETSLFDGRVPEALGMAIGSALKGTSPAICFGSATELGAGGAVYVIGALPEGLSSLFPPDRLVSVASYGDFLDEAVGRPPVLLVSSENRAELFERIRAGSVCPTVPITVVKETWSEGEVERLCLVPDILVAVTAVTDSQAFHARLSALLCNDRLLPPLTGVLVKRAVAYISSHAAEQISRWQLAEAVSVSEDYLTRIFRKETGLSPWDWLNRQRIHVATELLRQTGLPVNEVASRTGFRDQAYFSRVFKKIKGVSPGSMRAKAPLRGGVDAQPRDRRPERGCTDLS
jgi:AraC-like DNA-binding protein